MALIRKMTVDDLDRVSEIENESFSTPWSREAFRDIINNKTAIYMVAEEDGKIIGNCGIITALDEGDICNVAVDKEYRGRGIATQLVGEVMRCAGEELGTVAFTLEVRAGNTAAIKLYEKLGFVSEGIRPKFYEKPVEDALIMWRR